MSTKLNKDAYRDLIMQDMIIVQKMPSSLEKTHIMAVLFGSVENYDSEQQLKALREELEAARKEIKQLKRSSAAYGDYFSLTLDGMKPEEAAREVGLL